MDMKPPFFLQPYFEHRLKVSRYDLVSFMLYCSAYILPP